jgi:hypothetical protein
MATAAPTHLFHADHSIAGVAHPPNVGFVIRLEEAGPARTGVEFRTRPEERQTTKAARVNTILVVVEKNTAEGGLRAVLEQHVAFFLGETSNYRLALS